MNTEERYISLLTDFGFKRREYEDSLKAYRDIKNSIDTALEQGREEGLKKGMEKGLEKGLKKGLKKGREEGREEGRAEGEKQKAISIAKKMLQSGMDSETVKSLTGLTTEEIQSLT